MFLRIYGEHSMVEMSGPRTLENTKQWMFAKLKTGVHQMVSADVKITSSVIENLSGLDGASWAKSWVEQSDVFAGNVNIAEEKGDTIAARDNWYQAYGLYILGRFPCPNHPDKLASYDKEIAAYQKFGEHADPKIEVVTVPFDARDGELEEITFYVRMPKGIEKPPVVVMWGGCLERRNDNPDRRLG